MQVSEELLLTPEEDAEFRRIGATKVGDLTQKDLSRYHELCEKALKKIEELLESQPCSNQR